MHLLLKQAMVCFMNLVQTQHNWDTSQDIIDSNGNPVRYVKVYSNVAITPTNTPYFDGTSKYVVYGLNIEIVASYARNFFINNTD